MTVAFDTLKFARTLRDKANVPQDQAEAMAEAFADATAEQIATRADLSLHFANSETRFTRIEGRLNWLQWMLGSNLATSVALVFLALRH